MASTFHCVGRRAFIACVAIIGCLSYVYIYNEDISRSPHLTSQAVPKILPQFPATPVHELEVSQADTNGRRPITEASGLPQTKEQITTERNRIFTTTSQNAIFTTSQNAIPTATKQNVIYTTSTQNVASSPRSTTTTSTTSQKMLRSTSTKRNTSTQRTTTKPTTPSQKKTSPKPIKLPAHPKPTGLLVNSSTCKMSDYDPWDATVAHIVRKEKPFGGCRQNYPVKFEQEGNRLTLLVNSTMLKKGCEIDCCYRAVRRDKEGKSDDAFKLSTEITCFGRNRSMLIDTELVRISCWCGKSNATVYEDFRAFILPKHKNASVLNETAIDRKKILSVYMIAIDSVSRLNFKRQMPEIEAQLEELGAIPMSGLTKVGRNTLPNMLPFLAGMTIDELKKSYKGKPLDGLPVIWKDFSKLGYRTLYSEDESFMSTFNYLQKGFYITPTDDYMRPLYRAMGKSTFIKKGTANCINQRPHFNLQLHWLEDMIKQPGPVPHFALVFSNSLSHKGPLTYVHPMQSRLKQFLQTYRTSDRFTSSILIVFSDHGMRHGSILGTELGGYESRLPFFYILVPPWYSTRYPERFDNLRANSHRLTTFFDVHATLRNLLLDGGATEADLPQFRHRGVSLFQPIPLERTCESAEIAPHWCVCRARSPLPPNNTVVARAASAVVRHINDVLLRQVQSQCAELALSGVVAAFHTMSEGRRVQDEGHKRQAFEEVVVQLVTKPGLAQFEATVRCWKGKPQADGDPSTTGSSVADADWLEKQCRLEHPMSVLDVSRTNLYKGQSDCLKEGFEERLYCYCKDLL